MRTFQGPVYQQTGPTCGAAAAINTLRVFEVIDIPDVGNRAATYRKLEGIVFLSTRTSAKIAGFGSTPSKVVRYVAERLKSAGVSFELALANDVATNQDLRNYKSLQGPINAGLLKSLKQEIADINNSDIAPTTDTFTPDDVIIRFLDIGGSANAHFIVQTNFPEKGPCQFLDSGRSQNMDRLTSYDSYAAFLEDNSVREYRCTGMDAVFTDSRKN